MFIAAALLLTATNTFGDDATTATPNEPTKATYTISGLHCPPCTKPSNRPLRGQRMRSVKVDGETKSAKSTIRRENALGAAIGDSGADERHT